MKPICRILIQVSRRLLFNRCFADEDMETPSVQRERSHTCNVQYRYLTIALICLGFMVSSLVRSNINVAIIAMVNHTALNENVTQGQLGEDGPFVWDSHVQGLILSSFFWGYVVTNILGGRMAEKYGCKHFLGVGLLIASSASLLIPRVAYIHWGYVVAVRMLMGLALGPWYPTVTAMMAAWVPPLERSRSSMIVYNGDSIGAFFSSIITGLVSDTLGWDINFYLMGSLALAWSILWEIVAYDLPEEHPRISSAELDYIKESIGSTYIAKENAPPLPVPHIMSSAAVWAVGVAIVTVDSFTYMFSMYMPEFMSSMLHLSLTEIGTWMGVTSVINFFMSFLHGFVADFLLTKNLVTRTTHRKLNVAWIQWGGSACIVSLCFAHSNVALAIAVILLYSFFIGGTSSGCMVNPIDIAPNFSGTIFGLVNTASTLTAMVIPLVYGAILSNGKNAHTWTIVFLLASGINFIGSLVFLFFGSGEIQPWNNYHIVNEELNQEQYSVLENEDEAEENKHVT